MELGRDHRHVRQRASPELIGALRDDERVAGLTIGTRGNVVLEETAVTAYGFDRVRGHALPGGERRAGCRDVRPRSRWGRRRCAPWAKTSVTASWRRVPDGTAARLRIVGRTALPALALNGTDGLGDGAALTAGGLTRLDPTAEPSFFLVDFAPGASVAQLQRAYGDHSTTLGPQRPGAILTYGDVRSTPLLLAGLLGLLGAGVLVHLLVSSVRARRRDLAVLEEHRIHPASARDGRRGPGDHARTRRAR